MSRLNLFVITLSNLEGTYYAGQTVEGHCTVELVRDMCMKDLHVEFTGGATVSWEEEEKTKHGSDSSLREVTKSATENYVDLSVALLSDESQGSVTLPAGRHSFPFSFSLPHTVPSSFKGKYGKVTYIVKAVISRPWKTDHDTLKEVKVISLVDLDLDPKAMTPHEVQEEEMVCCLCCQSGPIVAKFRLERTGYILGEEVQFLATVNNGSGRTIDWCGLSLEMVNILCDVKYTAESDFKTSHKELFQVNSENFHIDPGRSSTWDGKQQQEQMLIPRDLPPSGLPGCSIMDVIYQATASLTPSPAVRVPVVGDEPDHQAAHHHRHHPLPLRPHGGGPPDPLPAYQCDPHGWIPSPSPLGPDQLRALMASAPPLLQGWEGERGEKAAWPPGLSAKGVEVPGFEPGVSAGAVELRPIGFTEDVVEEPPPAYDKCVDQWGHRA
ncbi:hypothetical protein ACOMHN_037376 [Nucella lapillus]